MKKSKQAMFESLLIPVKTRLPVGPGQVLLKMENGLYYVSKISDFLALHNLRNRKDENGKTFEYKGTGCFITHWMRLP